MSAGRRAFIVGACCISIFWPGALIFGFPGVMAGHWQTMFSVARADVGRILFFVLAAVGVCMFLVGKLQERYGPGRLVAAGSLVCAVAMTAVVRAASIQGVYVWAFFTGVSSALIYMPGLTVVQRWYPHRRGRVSGIFNLCFGGSAALASPLFSHVLGNFGFAAVAYGAAAATLLFGTAAAAFIRFPREDTAASGPALTSLSLTVLQSLRTRSFWLLWCTWALAGAAGISMVMLAVPFGLSRGLPMKEAVLLLTAFNLANGGSRLVSGIVSDFLGRRQTLALTFLLGAGAYFLFDRVENPVFWMVLAATIGYALGTLFAVSAPLASDCFGLAHFGAVYGLVFTAYGFFAGILGPWLSGYLLDRIGGRFGGVFVYLGVLFLLGTVLILQATPPNECVYSRGAPENGTGPR